MLGTFETDKELFMVY